jgi:hypothetical protein
MKSSLRPLVAVLLTALSVPVAFSQAADKPATPMVESMEKMDTAFKSLGRALKTPDAAQKAAYLESVGVIKAEAAKSRDLVPEKIAELPADQQAAMKEAFQKEMDAFIGLVADLEKAVDEERWADAETVIKGMRKAKSAGHESYKKE